MQNSLCYTVEILPDTLSSMAQGATKRVASAYQQID